MSDLKSRGYAVLEALLPPSLVDSHTKRVEELMEQIDCGHNVEWTSLASQDRVAMESQLNSIEIGDGKQMPLALAPELQDRMREAFGEEVILTSARTRLWEAGGRSPHFDTAALSTTPTHQVLRTWLALDDIAQESGIFTSTRAHTGSFPLEASCITPATAL